MALIQSIRFENYKRFARFSISCRTTNILSGPNNSGKSTTLDALRVFNAVHRYASRKSPIKRSHGEYGVCATYEVSQSAIGIPIENVVRDYGDEPAKIIITLDNKNSIHIELHPERQVLAFLETEAKIPNTAAEYKRLVPIDLIIVPTLSAIEEQERYVQDETVLANENTRLASRNFRNIVNRPGIAGGLLV